jgi:hypothetical protein
MQETTTDFDKVISDHNAIMPGEPQMVTGRGEDFTIRPFKFPQYAKAIKAVTRILSILKLQERFADVAKLATAEQGEDAEVGLGDFLAGLLDFETIAQVCDEAPEEIIALLMIATGKDRNWFDELDADEGLELTGAVLGVNMSFFMQKILPAISSAISRVKMGVSQLSKTSPTNAPNVTEFPGSTLGPTQ